MARMIEFHYYCDNADAKHPPRSATADTVLVYSPKHQQVREMEICDECLATLTLPEITTLVDALGREIDSPETDPTLVCPYGCNEAKPFKNPGGLTRHLTRKHPDHEG